MSSPAAPALHSEQPVRTTLRSPALLLLAIIFTVVYLGSVFSPPLLDDADSTHAEAAREMLARGDYITLHVNGIRYLEKAPLPYWLVAGSYRLFGINEFAARLPTTLAVLLLAWLGLAWGRRAFGERAGNYAGLFVLTCAGVYLFTRIFIPDVLLSLLIAASLYFLLTALELPGGAGRWYAGYACVALAVLTKGLVALVFVSMPAVIYLAITGEWRRWREFHLLSGLALFFAIAAPWHILAGLRNHGFFWFYFVNEHFLRFLGERYPKDYNKLPAALYWSLHLVWLFPWSFYLPSLVRSVIRDVKQRPAGVAEARARFAARTRLLCWIWAGLVLVFFALSTNQEYYTFPAYLPLLLLLADAVAREERQENGRHWLIGSSGAIALVSLVAGAALLAGLWYSRHLPFAPDIGTVLAKHNMAEDTLSMSHALDLSAESFAALRLPAILAVIALIAAPLLSLLLRLRRRPWQATWALAAGMALLLVAAHIALARFGPYLSSKALAQKIAAQEKPGDEVMIYGDQAFGSSLLFYLRQPIELVNGRTTSMWFGSTFPDAPKIFLKDGDLLQKWNGGGRVFLFVPPYEKKRVDNLLPRKYVVAEVSGKFVYSNRL
ncbi:MAG TPA: glycosyltransferase family 39 protein [Terriglobales bacterium]|nr:glycosyltransferase family 39 protein [Terriglobales bacterium]